MEKRKPKNPSLLRTYQSCVKKPAGHTGSKLLYFERCILVVVILVCCLCGISLGLDQPSSHTNTLNTKRKDLTINAESSCDLKYIIVSTIDGKVSVLDLLRKGKPVWSLEADSKPLYSSSLPNIKMIKNGKEMRLIPSLDGALYQFDGEKVEAIPMSAETLLSSTYRLSDDSMIVGSKELKSFGVDISTGQLLFDCGSEGCNHNKGSADDSTLDANSVLVITRNTQVVRSVDIKNGHEKWNFSVGQHDVKLPPASHTSQINDESDDDNISDNGDNGDNETHEEDGIPIFTHFKECPAEESTAWDHDSFLHLVVPEGRVVALDREDSNVVDWEHKFESPIAKAWLYHDGRLEAMSLFDSRHVPTLNTYPTEEDEQSNMPKPLLYIGSHQKLLYIQPSPQMEAILKSFPTGRIGHVLDPNIKVAWRPYQNTASTRTPIFGGNWDDRNRIADKDSIVSTSLISLHDQYPFDTGIFLYPESRDYRPSKRRGVMQIRGSRENLVDDYYMAYFPNSLWIYWRELLTVIGITVALHFSMVKYLKFSILGNAKINEVQSSSGSIGTNSNSQGAMVTDDSSASIQAGTNEYVSRFASDFDCLHCLGKGGFGIVFEAVNKVDDQHYAVKRISLPKSDGAKEKVLREVKALAKLEHSGIVRFFNAWVESPPVGWQEERDKSFHFSDVSNSNLSPTPSASLTAHSHPATLSSLHECDQTTGKKANRLRSLKRHNLKPGVVGEASLEDFEGLNPSFDPGVSNLQPAGSSGEFSVHSNIDESTSGDMWSHQSNNKLFSLNLNSISSSDNEFSQSGSTSSVPFSNYSSSTSTIPRTSCHKDDEITDDSIVFEGSTCGISSNSNSIVFADSSHKEENSKCSKGLRKASDHGIDVTLSSHCEDNDVIDLTPSPVPSSKLFLYIQMQLYRKDTLKDWLNNNTLNRDRQYVLTIFDEIVCAVDYIHKQGMMHRDLKPSNIFFSGDGHVKVGDFGLVTALTVQQDQHGDASVQIDEKHTAEVGTTLYMSPEQIANRPYDLKVDIFSLGLIFLELWVPFSTQMERIQTLHAAKKQSLPQRFIRELPSESDLVHKMTNLDPSLRPVTDEIMDHVLFQDLAFMRSDNRTRKRTVSEISIS